MQDQEIIQKSYAAVPVENSFEPVVLAPTPNDPPWNTPWAIGLWLASCGLILLLPNLFLIPYLLTRSIDLSSAEEAKNFLLSDPVAVLLQIGSVIPAHLITIVLAWGLVTKIGKYPFGQTLGWRLGGMRWWHFLAIIVGFLALEALIGHYFPENENELTRILESSRAAVFLVAFLATFSAPIVEEIVYRGVLYSALQRSAGYYPAIAIVTAAFAGVHFFQYWGSPGSLILITVLSLVLTLVRARTNNLLPCIILHFIFNGIQSAILIAQPYAPTVLKDADNAGSFIQHFLK